MSHHKDYYCTEVHEHYASRQLYKKRQNGKNFTKFEKLFAEVIWNETN